MSDASGVMRAAAAWATSRDGSPPGWDNDLERHIQVGPWVECRGKIGSRLLGYWLIHDAVRDACYAVADIGVRSSGV